MRIFGLLLAIAVVVIAASWPPPSVDAQQVICTDGTCRVVPSTVQLSVAPPRVESAAIIAAPSDRPPTPATCTQCTTAAAVESTTAAQTMIVRTVQLRRGQPLRNLARLWRARHPMRRLFARLGCR